MSLNNFIPVVWASRLLVNLRKAQIYAQTGIVNRNFEGDIRQAGDSVRINAIGAVTVGTYTKNTNISDPETLTDAQTTLLIDQAKYFNFQIDDVDRAQQTPKALDEAMTEAAYALADRSDQFVAALYTDAATTNLIGTTASPKTDLGTAGKAYEYLVDLGVKLDEANVPRSGRWVIVPPWYHGLLQKDDRFVKAGTTMSDMVLRNGEIGAAAGLRVMVSNNVPYTTITTKFRIMAGYVGAITFAEQIASVEAYRPPNRFGDAMKGLQLYGAKVVRPAGIAVLTADRPS
jgi:N4-gp56 family major capsid protein